MAAAESRVDATERIRELMREQKRSCACLRFNPLFNEFSRHGTTRLKPPADNAIAALKDVEGEARSRTLDLVQSAREALELAQCGVWASLGKPYVCLGRPVEIRADFRKSSTNIKKLKVDQVKAEGADGTPASSAPAQAAMSLTTASPTNHRSTSFRFPKEPLVSSSLRRTQAMMDRETGLDFASNSNEADRQLPPFCSKARLKDWYTSLDVEHCRTTENDGISVAATRPVTGRTEKSLPASSRCRSRLDMASTWRDAFEQVRQKAAFQLQKSLEDREESRETGRRSFLLTACCMDMILTGLDLGRLKKSAPIHSEELPVDTWTRAIRSQNKFRTQMTCKSFRGATFKATDADAFERFYSNLCHLVRLLGQAAPELVFVIEKAKELLENGGTLNRGFLNKIVRETKGFMEACGRLRCTKKLQTLLRYIARCSRVDDADLDQVSNSLLEES